MADRKLNYAVGVTDNITGPIQKAARNVKRSMKDMQDGTDDTASKVKLLGDVVRDMADKIEGSLDNTAAIAERLGRSMPDEDARRFADMLDQAGVSARDLDEHTEDLVAEMQRLEQVSERAGHNIRRGMDDAGDSVRRVGSDSDQSMSVLANAAGNATQDVGQLAGVSGTAGMAIGQLAEYATEGGISLRNLAKVAGPMALLAVATVGVSSAMEKAAKSKELDRRRTTEYAAALRETGDAASVLRDELEETGKLEVDLPGALGIVDLAPALDAVGLTIDQFSRLAGQGEERIAAWGEEMVAAGADAGTVDAVMLGLHDTAENLAAAEDLAARNARLLGDEFTATSDAATTAAPNLDVFAAATGRASEQADAAADALGRANDELADLLDTSDTLPVIEDNLAEALRNAAEQAQGLAEGEASAEERYSAFLDVISGGAGELDDYIRQLMESGMSAEDAAAQANGYLDQLFDLAVQFGLSREQAEELRRQLGLDYPTVTARVETVGAAEAEWWLAMVRARLAEIAEMQAIIQARNIAFAAASPGFSIPALSTAPGGKFHGGGVVSGPYGADRLIVAAGGETVRTPAQERQLQQSSVVINVDARGADRDALGDGLFKLQNALANLTTRGDG